jgi:hypothetical protein
MFYISLLVLFMILNVCIFVNLCFSFVALSTLTILARVFLTRIFLMCCSCFPYSRFQSTPLVISRSRRSLSANFVGSSSCIARASPVDVNLQNLMPRPHCLHVDRRHVEFYMSSVAFYMSTGFWRQKRSLSTCRQKLNMFSFGDMSTVYILHVALLCGRSPSISRPFINIEVSTCRRSWRHVEVDMSTVAFYKSTISVDM